MIELSRVTKRYGDRTVLSELSIRFTVGTTVSVVGPSGGGKSTLLRCINGLEPFDAGELRVGSDVIASGDAHGNRRALSRIRRRVGFVFQDYNLFANRTALGNVIEAPVHVRKIPRAEATERARELLARVGLAHRALAYPHEMSGGEQQRVAIARALAMDPEVLLLDEPTSALDAERRDEVLRVLLSLAGGGSTMILVTHETRFAREVSQRVILLQGGTVTDDGPPETVLKG
jgi:polar amino acid transport system ATP-binding protein